MSLSCSCDEWDGDGWAYNVPYDFSIFSKKKRKRCCSCKELIDIGSDCLEFERSRYAKTEIEYRIYGDDNEIGLAPWWMCEKCGEIFLNLESLGYCLDIAEPMSQALNEYREMTGFKPVVK